MAEIEKLKGGELDAVSGGTKYNIGSQPVNVYDAPAGRLRFVLYPGDFLVTDGTFAWANGICWHHVYLQNGEGYVDGRIL